jgi:predicted permease
MDIFLFILMNNVAPIFLLIVVGYILGKKFKLDIRSLVKINFYMFVPTLIFSKIYETQIEMDLLKAFLFGVILLILNFLSSTLVSKLRGYSTSLESAFKNSVMFYNSGNFGLPLISLVFKDSPAMTYAISIQIMILLVQNLSTNTLGFYNAGRSHMKLKDTILAILKMPVVYAISCAFLLKAIPYDFTQTFVWPAVSYVRDGLISVALLTLGVQLSVTKLNFRNKDAYLASFMRLLGGPLMAYLLILLFRVDGAMAQVLMISSAVPTAVNSALIAVEFDNEPDFASQVVLTTTLLSAVTVTGVIYLAKHIFA